MDQSPDKLALGAARLARARRLSHARDGDSLDSIHDRLDAADDALGLALLSFHGALEDHYRAVFEQSARIPAARKRTPDGHSPPLRDMLKLLLDYQLISIATFTSMNDAIRYRNRFAHGEPYPQTLRWVEGYAALAHAECDNVATASSPASRPTQPNQPPRPQPSQPRRPPPAHVRSRPARPAAYGGLRLPDSLATLRMRMPAALDNLRRSNVVQRLMIFILLILLLYLVNVLARG